MHFSAEAAREILSPGLIFRRFRLRVGFFSKSIVLLKENHTFSISTGSLFLENVRKLMRRPIKPINAARTTPVPLDRPGVLQKSTKIQVRFFNDLLADFGSFLAPKWTHK